MAACYSRESIISNISIKGGDYSREAINRGTAIIRGNTVVIIEKYQARLFFSPQPPYTKRPLRRKEKFSGGGTPGNSWWGCDGRFSKS